ncbi:MAG: OmpA family protein [Pseudomonadota bacterium]
MGRVLTMFFGLLGIGLIFAWCIRHAEHIEAEIQADAQSALTDAGFDSITASADGQFVALAGRVADESLRDRAIATVAALPHVLRVDSALGVEAFVPPPAPDATPLRTEPDLSDVDDLAVERLPQAVTPNNSPETTAAPPESTSLSLAFDGTGRTATLSGVDAIGTDLGEQSLLLWLGQRLPGFVVSGADAIGTQDLLDTAEALLPGLADAQSARLDISEAGIDVSAEWTTYEARAAYESRVGLLDSNGPLRGRAIDLRLASPEPTAVGCQAAFDDALNLRTIRFASGRAVIEANSLPLLNRLLEVLQACDVAIVIAGHTDATGDAALNERLSLRRAEAVRRYLVERGAERARIEVAGFGASQPIASNATTNGRRQNRRIEFRVVRNPQ